MNNNNLPCWHRAFETCAETPDGKTDHPEIWDIDDEKKFLYHIPAGSCTAKCLMLKELLENLPDEDLTTNSDKKEKVKSFIGAGDKENFTRQVMMGNIKYARQVVLCSEWGGVRSTYHDTKSVDSAIELLEASTSYLKRRFKHKTLPSEELKQELERYKNENNIKYEEDINMLDFAQHFANWQKEQLMKYTIEDVQILDFGGNNHLDFCFDDNVLLEQGFKDEDKVKLIILKED